MAARGNERDGVGVRGEMLARVKGWGELGLGPWRSWAADGGLKRWAGLGCLSLLSPSNFLAEKK